MNLQSVFFGGNTALVVLLEWPLLVTFSALMISVSKVP